MPDRSTPRPTPITRPAALALALAVALLAGPGVAAQGAGASPFDPALLAGMEARAIGPATMSGRVAAVTGNPGRPGRVWVGAATGGVWRSDDSGVTWSPVFDDQPVASIGAIGISPANPDRIWVGTGEGNPRNSASVGNGVYLSDDGGETWHHLGLATSERIHRILPHPRDPDTAFACAMGPTWGEGGERGVYRTRDGGDTWQPVLTATREAARLTTGCADLELDPANPNHLVAALWDHQRWPWFFRSGGAGSGLFVSRDGGDTWREATAADGLPEGPLGRIGLGLAPSRPDTVYAFVEAETNGVYRSSDGGDTWELRSEEPAAGNRPFYYADLRVDPADPERIYSLWSRVSVSDDGGASWQILVPFSTVHPDHHAMWIDPADPTHLWNGNDGGVYESRDHGHTWRFVANLPLAQYYHVRVDDSVPYRIYGGLQDNGSWAGPAEVWQNGGIRNFHWQEVSFGDGFDTVPIPGDPDRGYSMSQEGYLVRWDLETGEQKMIRPAGPPAEDGSGGREKLRFNWNAAIAPDPFDPDTVYFGSQFVHRSRDRGETWEIVSPDLTTDDPRWQNQERSGGLTLDVTGAENFTSLVALAPSPVERGVLWAGSDDGRLHVTRDGGETWTSVEGNVPGVPEHTWIPHVEASPHDAATAFVVFDNHRRSDWTPYVYETTDFGATWRRLAGSGGGGDGHGDRRGYGQGDGEGGTSPAVRGYALSIVQDPVDPELLFLGTELGLWFSTDRGGAWHPFRHGVPTVSVMDLVIQERESDLVLGTHGRSLYVVDDVSPLRSVDAATLAEPLHLFPIPEAQQYWVQQSPGTRMAGHGEFRGANEPYGALVTFSVAGDDLPLPDPEADRRRRLRELDEVREEGARALTGIARGELAVPAGEETGEEDPSGEEAEDGEGEDEEAPKVEVEIRDSEGELIRSFDEEVHRGVNRLTWDLTHDAPAEPDPGDLPRWREPSGPQVVPGEYRITLRFRGEEASAPVTVAADPRLGIPLADRRAKLAALQELGDLQEVVTRAIDRLVITRRDVETLLDRHAAALADDEGRDEEEGSQEGGGEADAGDDPLTRQGRELLRAIGEEIEALWTPPGTQGIRPANTPWDRVDEAKWIVGNDWHAPTPSQLTYLAEARRSVAAAVERVNAFYGDRVAPFRQAVRDGGPTLLPEAKPLTLPE